MKRIKELVRFFWPEAVIADPREQLYASMSKKGCLDCEKQPPIWFEGPKGGLSTNIFCGYCGQGYNITPVVQWAERIHKDEKYIDVKKVTH